MDTITLRNSLTEGYVKRAEATKEYLYLAIEEVLKESELKENYYPRKRFEIDHQTQRSHYNHKILDEIRENYSAKGWEVETEEQINKENGNVEIKIILF